jgi:o-succinylbenzoate synthase
VSLKLEFQRVTLRFKFEAGTSRGTLREKDSWIIKLWEKGVPGKFGLGELSPLPGLSLDDKVDYQHELTWLKDNFPPVSMPKSEEDCLSLAASLAGLDRPSLRFALETALIDLWTGSRRILYPSAFTAGNHRIPVNGLIWMGNEVFMEEQARQKIAEGYTCLKMKIGAINFSSELQILRKIKQSGVRVLRTDANGAFFPDEVMGVLKQLSQLNLHSIEQPIAAGDWQMMARICRISLVPIALDEELIGIEGARRKEMLHLIKPQFIVLKPTLLGGIVSTLEWIRLAEEMGIRWWITSALESNIGLNVISQLTAWLNYQGHQGLGTGQLYENNFDSPMNVSEGFMQYTDTRLWNFNQIEL